MIKRMSFMPGLTGHARALAASRRSLPKNQS
jgi:hypothetical protein